jgi:hypothetical protein
MREIYGDLWSWLGADAEAVVAVTTNGVVSSAGEAVMGRGCALEARKIFNGLPARLGALIKERGNIPFYFKSLRLVTFPTKNHWRDRSDLKPIRNSAEIIAGMADEFKWNTVVIPRPGCSNGGLTWAEVRPVIEPFFNDDRFIVIAYPSESTNERGLSSK